MAKNQPEHAIVPIKIDLAVEIQKHDVNQELLLEFTGAKKAGDAIAQGSLVDYIQEKFYKEKNIVVVPDLSGKIFGRKTQYQGERTEENLAAIRADYLDLSSIDFTGSNLKGATFENCNLRGASFCDSDLGGVSFNDCSMPGADMRGADISNCRFREDNIEEFLSGDDSTLKPAEASEMLEQEKSARYADLYFSSAEPLMHQYRVRNEDIIASEKEGFENEKSEQLAKRDQRIAVKQEQINEVYKELTYLQRAYALAGSTGHEKYDELVQQKVFLDNEKQAIIQLDFDKDFDKSKIPHIIDPTIAELPLLMKDVGIVKFDPAYVRGSNKEARTQEKQYLRLTREDAEEYLAKIKTEGNAELTLNDFAKTKAAEKGVILKDGAKTIADFSTYIEDGVGAEYAGKAVNLAGLDFSGANLQEACFAGANLEKCKFNRANLSKSTFEAANLKGTEFNNTNAKDATFFYSDMSPSGEQRTRIIDSNFERSFMRGSEAVEAIVERSNFNYSNIRNGNWDEAVIQEAHFDYADMEGISLAGAKLREVTMKHALLDKAIMNNTELIGVNLTNAMMLDVKAQKIKIRESILQNVDARAINLEEAEIDKFSKLEGLNLEKAILEKIKADEVDFRKVNLQEADLRFGSFIKANLENVNARFAQLEGAIIEGANASGIDLTGAQIEKLRAAKANLNQALMHGVKGDEIDFSDALMQGAELRGAKMRNIIMQRVDARKLQAQGAQLPGVDLRNAKIEGLEIDPASDLHGAKIEGAIGRVKEHQIDGQSKDRQLEEVVKEHNEVHAAEKKSWLAKKLGNAMQYVGQIGQKIGGIIKQPVSEKWGRIIGAVAGTLIVGAIAASAVVTMGASLAVTAAVIAGASAIGGVGGGVVGHYGAKKLTAIHLASIAAGGLMGGPVVALVAGGVAHGVENGVRILTGKGAAEHLGGIFEAGGRFVEGTGDNLGVSQEVERRIDERRRVAKLYVAPARPELDHAINRDEERERLKQRANQAKQGLVSDISEVQTKPIIENPRESAKEIGNKQREKEGVVEKDGNSARSKSKKENKANIITY